MITIEKTVLKSMLISMEFINSHQTLRPPLVNILMAKSGSDSVNNEGLTPMQILLCVHPSEGSPNYLQNSPGYLHGLFMALLLFLLHIFIKIQHITCNSNLLSVFSSQKATSADVTITVVITLYFRHDVQNGAGYFPHTLFRIDLASIGAI
ncbi:hypothetical protein CRM22_001718 [Opisthorchis felineus]|uniref:Uncharacterized protein n=1 Tax=Opisthorchis felineus TaxID=147828 RepID=A0A4S2M9F5_OPIFE|nr:hypothetical protein CRM22_001718 [Opisthorchis felineus]TGZ73121.1 hypothetical protein CRM22_001718 [Opisthorchis felineus]